MKVIFNCSCICLILVMGGCCTERGGLLPCSQPSHKHVAQKVEPAPESSPTPAPVAAPAPCQQTGMIKIEKFVPNQIQAGREFSYDIVVTNLTGNSVDDVLITETLDPTLKVTSTIPEAKAEDGRLLWTLNSMAVNESKKLSVTAAAQAPGSLRNCANATYKMPSCAMIEVVQPKLALTMSVISDATPCDPIPVKFVVNNNGTGVAQNAVINVQLADGLANPDGTNMVRIDAGPLNAGESKSFDMNLQAKQVGQFTAKASAVAEGGLTAESQEATVKVRQAVLAIKENAPEKEYIGRPVKYEIAVTNTGDTVAVNTKLAKTLFPAAKLISASDNGVFTDGVITWNLNNIEPNQFKTVEYVIQADEALKATMPSQAVAECTQAATGTASTQFSGIAAVLLEMVDVIDPILVGQDETYIIKVTNQGTATDTNIRIVAELEDTMQYVSSNGPTEGRLEGNKVIFAPLPSLAAKDVATWNVIIKPTATADARFGVTLQTDVTERPVVKTESTHFYK